MDLLKEPSDDHEDQERPMIQHYGVRFLAFPILLIVEPGQSSFVIYPELSFVKYSRIVCW